MPESFYFTQTGIGFTVRRTMSAYARCLKSIAIRKRSPQQQPMDHHLDDGGGQQRHPVVETASASCERAQMEVLALAVDFLVESGHQERCFYLLALLVDVNVCKLAADREVDTDDVRGFATSGKPFIGEEGSKGQ